MLKNIRLHLEKDDEAQLELDKKLAERVSILHKKNINVFQRNIPSLVQYLQKNLTKNISIFNNWRDEANIVNISTGRTLYGLHPESEITKQVQLFEESPLYLNIDLGAPAITDEHLTRDSELECMIVFGCGMGLHLEQLIERFQIKHLIVYEPEIQYFQCSALLTEWEEIFKIAKEKGTHLYLQLEKDGRHLLDDVSQLLSVFQISRIYFFRHYNNVVFNKICSDVKNKSYEKLKVQGFSFNLEESLYDFCPLWTYPNAPADWHPVDTRSSRYNDNLRAFKTLFPEIYKVMDGYEPKAWFPCENDSGEINLHHKEFDCYWYGEYPKEESSLNLNQFVENPNKDGLVLGYEGEKLAHYMHYKFVKKTEDLLKKTEEKVGSLPEEVQSVIVFGLAAGYQLEEFFFNHKIEYLFICEPNLDFFHASLFSIDWKAIFRKISKEELRIYINLGETSGNLIKDLMKQFYSLGPYILNNTYFYQSYYNTQLNNSIKQLREQLQIVISMGEYFDHAYYGIAHTQYSISKSIKYMASNPSSRLSYTDKEVPVFLVGNGPSLDMSIDTIREFKDRALIISCGTSLQVLYKHNIVPDFHAEIEQNRTTYDWASLINAPEFLKTVSLLSCNGIHPDTTTLYKDVYLTFKEGESSTVSTTAVFGEDKFEILEFAFPTVGNLATNLFTKMGFHNIYLIGIDLGFIDAKKHHSVESAYYNDDGSQLSDYEQKNNTNFVVPGNFRKAVNTKHEFYVAKQMLEQTIAHSTKGVTYYNCSDGAGIIGTNPLPLSNIIVSGTEAEKNLTLGKIKGQLFLKQFDTGALAKLQLHYSRDTLKADFEKLKEAIYEPLATNEDGEKLTENHRKLLIESYKGGKSLLFFYLHGTINYANAVLAKLVHASNDGDIVEENLNLFKEYWLNYLDEIEQLILANQMNFDISTYCGYKRAMTKNANHVQNNSLFIVTDSQACVDATKVTADMFQNGCNWSITGAILANDGQHVGKADYVVHFREFGNEEQLLTFLKTDFLTGEKSTAIIVEANSASVARDFLNKTHRDINVVAIFSDGLSNRLPDWFYWYPFIIKTSIETVIQNHRGVIILPKYTARSGADMKTFIQKVQSFEASYVNAIDYINHVVLQTTPYDNLIILPNGNRGSLLHKGLKPEHLIMAKMDDNQLEQTIDIWLDLCPSLLSYEKYTGDRIEF